MSVVVTEASRAGEGGGEAGLYFSFLLQKNQKKKIDNFRLQNGWV